MPCGYPQHPSVTVRTKIIYLMKVSSVLDFDAKADKAIMLNERSDVGGLAWTSRDLGVPLWTTKFATGFPAARPRAVDRLAPEALGRRRHGNGRWYE
jgi:hypothetical protein